MHTRPRHWFLSALLIGLALISPVAYAQTNSWTNAAGGKWESAGNWLLGAPGLTQSGLMITNANSKTVLLDAATAASFPASLSVSNLTVGGVGGFTNTLQVFDLSAPLMALQGLVVDNGGLLDISNSATRTNLTGGQLTILGTVQLNGGYLRPSWISVPGGELVFNNGTITGGMGIGSGNGRTGRLTVHGGGFRTDGFFSLGWLTPGAAELVMDGGWVSFQAGQFGGDAPAKIILNGGMLQNTFSLDMGGPIATPTTMLIDGGRLIMTNAYLHIGGFGAAAVTISNGSAEIMNLQVGRFYFPQSGSRGTLTIAGSIANSQVRAASMVVGACAQDAIGTVAIEGGALFVTNASHSASLNILDGTCTIHSGQLTVDQLVVTSSCARVIHTGGNLTIGSLVLDPNLCAVGDGIPNGWKQQYGLDPFDPNLANEDNAGTGQNNLFKYLAGLNPTNPASVFRVLAVTPASNDVLVSWQAGGGRTNVVQAVPDLIGSYTNISPNIIVPGPGDVTTNYLDVGGATNGAARFYRVRLVP